MSKPKFAIGDIVETDFSSSLTKTRITRHRIIDVERGKSQTGILYAIDPPLTPGPERWIDQDWFEPVKD